MTALYRKYRPQTFAEVVGQEAVVRTLTNAVGQGKIRQAYLFAGPRGTGKTSLARILAKAARKWHLPADFEWLLGTHAQLAPVWRAYGIAVRPTKDGDVEHSDAFYVVDRSGDERAGFLSPFIPGLLTRDLRRLAAET